MARTLGFRIAVTVAASVGASIALVTGVSALTEFQRVRAAGVQAQLAHAARIADEAERRVTLGRQLAHEASTAIEIEVRSGRPDRTAMNHLLHAMTEREPDIFGVWFVSEPNAFDGRDQAFAGVAPSDLDGAFVPYWRRKADGAIVQDTTGEVATAQEDRAADYYTAPVAAGRDVLLEPYIDQMEESPTDAVLMTTVSRPVYVDGRLIGVVGVDFALDDIRDLVNAQMDGSDLRADLISDGGFVLSDNAESGSELSRHLMETAAEASIAPRVVEYPESGEPALTTVTEIEFDGLDARWTLLVSQPQATLIMHSLLKASMQFSIGLAGLLVAAVVAFRMAPGIARPIVAARRSMEILAAEGELDEELKPSGTLEIDAMLEALGGFAQALRDRRRLQALSKQQAEENERALEELKRQYQAAAEGKEQVAREMATAMRRLFEGDLSYRIETYFPFDYRSLRMDYNQAINRVEELVRQIKHTADTIGERSSEMAASSHRLSEKTENASAGLSITSSALEEITRTIDDNIRGAGQVRDAVQSAYSEAHQGRRVLSDTVESIEQLDRASAQISNIINVIDEIAFQTNLLALNAGIEAARAGDAGRGFAVVAQEVRSLAQRTAEAAKEIKGLIQSTDAQVKEGVRMARGSGAAIDAIVGRVEDINTLVQSMATLADEQTQSLMMVRMSIGELADVSNDSIKIVEQSACISSEAAQEAAALQEVVSSFTVSGETKAEPPKAETIAQDEAEQGSDEQAIGLEDAAEDEAVEDDEAEQDDPLRASA